MRFGKVYEQESAAHLGRESQSPVAAGCGRTGYGTKHWRRRLMAGPELVSRAKCRSSEHLLPCTGDSTASVSFMGSFGGRG